MLSPWNRTRLPARQRCMSCGVNERYLGRLVAGLGNHALPSHVPSASHRAVKGWTSRARCTSCGVSETGCASRPVRQCRQGPFSCTSFCAASSPGGAHWPGIGQTGSGLWERQVDPAYSASAGRASRAYWMPLKSSGEVEFSPGRMVSGATSNAGFSPLQSSAVRSLARSESPHRAGLRRAVGRAVGNRRCGAMVAMALRRQSSAATQPSLRALAIRPHDACFVPYAEPSASRFEPGWSHLRHSAFSRARPGLRARGQADSEQRTISLLPIEIVGEISDRLSAN